MIRKFKNNLTRRKLRTRLKIKRVKPQALRLSVFRSNKHIYSQIIDLGNKGKVLVSACDQELKTKTKSKKEKAEMVGKLLAQKALAKKIKKVVFDKGPYSFKGRIKILAEGARKGGLIF